jgi:hypothetical protein
MEEDFKNKFDLSKPRRDYYSKDCGLTICPECGSQLIADNCTVLIAAKSDTDEGEFISNLSGSHFCNSCPVVVLDSKKIEHAARLGLYGDSNLRFLVAGIVNLNAIPKDKRNIQIGTDENPMPLVKFLPNHYEKTSVKEKKTGRNEPCPCGSGKKYKNCCL